MDYHKMYENREFLDPYPLAPGERFPESDLLPEGCIVIEEQESDWGIPVDLVTDVVYIDRPEGKLHLNILMPRSRTKRWPCIVYTQGSAFRKQVLFRELAQNVRLAALGYVVAIVEYRHSGIKPFPAQAEDCKSAIRFLRKHAEEYRIDPEHMAAVGDSSGGHTSLMVGFSREEEFHTGENDEYSSKVNAIIDLYSPTIFSVMNCVPSSMEHRGPDGPEGCEIGGFPVLEHPELVRPTIPMEYLEPDRETPPVMIVHGSRDQLVPFEQSCFLYECLKKMGKTVVFYKLMGADHGNMTFHSDRLVSLMDEFLKKYI